ncbi:MAG: thioredoxin domain-containing protein, partial [Flavihumibacter sp.]
LYKIMMALVLATGLAGCANAQVKALDAAAFADKIQTPGQILDVRTRAEFTSGYIDQAMQADWQQPDQFNDRTAYLDKSKPVYVYCASGVRSKAAATALAKKGFDVYTLNGGLFQWKKAGLPVTGGDNKAGMSVDAYQQKISQKGYVLVDVGAAWCPPCRQMIPVLDSLQKEKPNRYQFLQVDGGNDTDIMKALNVGALPHFLLYKDGRLLWQQQGLVELATFRRLID